MNVKEEVKQAKEHAGFLHAKGLPLGEIMTGLNVAFEGFYHIVEGRIVRDQDADYLPPLFIFQEPK